MSGPMAGFQSDVDLSKQIINPYVAYNVETGEINLRDFYNLVCEYYFLK